ncbi:MAG: hypothetical protein MZW92_10130 [Comamonadaceae bacterium]|nr:hypothetical protein [Comamonadaceae bacterium]
MNGLAVHVDPGGRRSRAARFRRGPARGPRDEPRTRTSPRSSCPRSSSAGRAEAVEAAGDATSRTRPWPSRPPQALPDDRRARGGRGPRRRPSTAAQPASRAVPRRRARRDARPRGREEAPRPRPRAGDEASAPRRPRRPGRDRRSGRGPRARPRSASPRPHGERAQAPALYLRFARRLRRSGPDERRR